MPNVCLFLTMANRSTAADATQGIPDTSVRALVKRKKATSKKWAYVVFIGKVTGVFTLW